MQRWIGLAVALVLTVVISSVGYAQAPSSGTPTDKDKMGIVDKPVYPGQSVPIRADGVTPITTTHNPTVEKPTYPGMSVPLRSDGTTPITDTTNFGQR